MTDAVSELRAFSRFYTAELELLGPGLLDTPHTLAESRVLFELAQQPRVEVADLRARLRIDAGHLSRLLARLERRGLVARERSPADGRRQVARLTAAGEEAFAELDRRSAEQAGARLDGIDRDRLAAALADVRRLLDPAPPPPAVVLRAPRPGDLGWIVQRHGQLYADELGWDGTFEVLVAGIVARFAERRDPAREAAWIAEVDGAPAGSVLCVREDDDVARLRLLLVEPRARGLGLGARLVAECLAFARAAGYRELRLWTNDVLVHARLDLRARRVRARRERAAPLVRPRPRQPDLGAALVATVGGDGDRRPADEHARAVADPGAGGQDAVAAGGRDHHGARGGRRRRAPGRGRRSVGAARLARRARDRRRHGRRRARAALAPVALGRS